MQPSGMDPGRDSHHQCARTKEAPSRGGSAPAVGSCSDRARAALAAAAGVLVADYGRGVASASGVPEALAGLSARVPLVWDPHPRGGPPVPGARLATPNRKEAAALAHRREQGIR